MTGRAAASARAQHWSSADRDVADYVRDAVAIVADGLSTAKGDGLVAAYLHGSLALGTFYRPKSDLDLLFVSQTRLTAEQRGLIGRALTARARTRPLAGDLELSVVTRAALVTPRMPVPYEFHYSAAWRADIAAGRVDWDWPGERCDPDLACHLTYVRQRGITLVGPAPADLVGRVRWADFLASVVADACELLVGGGLVSSPVYGVLNLCRVLQLLAEDDGRVHSKEDGARWGLDHLPPEHRPLVRRALAAYRSAEPVSEAERATAGWAWDADALQALADHARPLVAP